jgi:mannose-6-phosphate isomerase-like protein (cupin superfamily)
VTYQVAHLDELDRIPVDQGLEWRPILRRFGIQAFGVNAYTSEKVGDWVIEEHTETVNRHEELYVVVRGRARFTLGGEDDVDAPVGTFVFLPDPEVKRVAIAEEEGTAVLAVGAKPGEAFTPSGWEWSFAAAAQEPEEAVATMKDGIATLGESAPGLYHLARHELRAGRRDDARDHLARALELDPSYRTYAEEDDDLKELL